MGCQMLESVSHDLQEVDLLIDGVGDGANIAGEPSKQASEGSTTLTSGTEARMEALMDWSLQMTSDLQWFSNKPSSAATRSNTPRSCRTSSRFPPRVTSSK